MTACTLTLNDVGFRYKGGHEALSEVSLRLERGIVGLLGPNGAGKSTLMRILATLAKPTRGHVQWNGEDTARRPDALRRTLGYLPQDFGVYPMLSAREFLSYLSAVKGISAKGAKARVDECLAQVGLSEVGERRLGEFSGGMRQRVGIAQALLNDPRLLIVDEPTVGLDPEERLRFRHLLTDLAVDRLVILSTHIVSDIEASAGSLAIMAKGRLLFSGTPEALIATAAGHVWEWTVPAPQVAAVRANHVTTGSQQRADGVRLRLVAERSPSADAVPASASLEDAHLWLVSRGEKH
ncbi:MAG: ABC transporter, ATP-binding protein [uncultured Lysobacter sp.]|uniref:ABC transporter, ATP-binding protein n=1 Tax=uncultured Lysobacter sp. TaxID=271060 RepID=A0A6J4KAN9_9GAMM|nr:MAG: ABC transporter, ATP-binding protein [uncultured Lysobacter sp.]